jgi:hypothetical protein
MKATLKVIIFWVCFLGSITLTFSQSSIPLKPYDIDWRTGNQTEFNLSGILDKPAGAAGFVQIKNGHFFTADGKRLKIWGVNLTGGACFPEKEDAPRIAAFFARYGLNGVRFHFLDSQWGSDRTVIDLNEKKSRKLNQVQLDKFDYFVAELKKQGIYTNINLNVGRGFKPGDGIPESEYLGFAKAATLFNERMIMLQKEYARQLLTHLNPYTGNRYTNEPAVIIVEIVNENSLVEAWFGNRLTGNDYSRNPSTWSGIPPYYAMELTRIYNEWLNDNISTEQIESIAKEAGRNEDGLIPRMENSEFKNASELRFYTEASFIMNMEKRFFSEMHHFLKSTLGLKAHVAGTSDHNHYKSGYPLLSSLSELDVTDGHVYWQHPGSRQDSVTGERKTTFNFTPMVNEPAKSSVVQLSRSAILNKPYTVSETNHPFPSEYACEGIPVLAAYALLQDWDGIFHYTMEHADPKDWLDKAPGSFDIYHDPSKMTNLAVAGLIFHRGDISAADSIVIRDYNQKEIIEGIRWDFSPMPFFTPGFNPVLPLIYRTRIGGFFREHNEYPELELTNPVVSQNGELKWFYDNDKGLVTINTSKSQGFTGFVKDFNIELPNLQVDIENKFCAVILSALDDKDLSESEDIILAATSKFELTDMKYNDTRTELIQQGKKPGLIEPVTGLIQLNNMGNVKSVELIIIGGDGNRIDAKTIKPDSSGKISFRIGNPASPLYLIRVHR